MNLNIRLQTLLANSPIATVLPAITELNLPNWWLAGGAVRNTIWHSIFGKDCALFIKDFDIAFFDEQGNRSQELAAKATLTNQFPNYQFDVKNQASFARWRPGSTTYTSTENGITNWLHTATAVGVRLDTQGQWQFFTPYGLDDLFAGVIRPTPAHINNPDAQNKAAEFLQKCPCLRLG
ncbi:MAG: nucleotidyltransferase family protein [Heteroscytonema crispum UTEX LB 1556]